MSATVDVILLTRYDGLMIRPEQILAKIKEVMDLATATFDYLRANKLPHIWCPGCGDGIIVGALIRAIARMGWSRDEVVVVTGIDALFVLMPL